MKTKLVIATLSLLGLSALGKAQTCASYSFNQTTQYDDVSDPTGHTSGDHLFAGTATASCTYSSTPDTYCQIVNSAIGTVEPTDSGELTTWPLGYKVCFHYERFRNHPQCKQWEHGL